MSKYREIACNTIQWNASSDLERDSTIQCVTVCCCCTHDPAVFRLRKDGTHTSTPRYLCWLLSRVESNVCVKLVHCSGTFSSEVSIVSWSHADDEECSIWIEVYGSFQSLKLIYYIFRFLEYCVQNLDLSGQWKYPQNEEDDALLFLQNSSQRSAGLFYQITSLISPIV